MTIRPDLLHRFIGDLSDDANLATDLREAPRDALARLQYLQPEERLGLAALIDLAARVARGRPAAQTVFVAALKRMVAAGTGSAHGKKAKFPHPNSDPCKSILDQIADLHAALSATDYEDLSASSKASQPQVGQRKKLLEELTAAEASLDACRIAHGGRADLRVKFVGWLIWTYKDWDPNFFASARNDELVGPKLPATFAALMSFDILFRKYAHTVLDISGFNNGYLITQDPSVPVELILFLPGFPFAVMYATSASVTKASFSFSQPKGGPTVGKLSMRLTFDYNYDPMFFSPGLGSATATADLEGDLTSGGLLDLAAKVVLSSLSTDAKASLFDPSAPVNSDLGIMHLVGTVPNAGII